MLNTIIPSIPAPLTEALAMVFLHSLWQFTFIAAILSLVLKRNWLSRSPSRYSASLLAMVVMVLSAVVTFFYYYQPAADITVYSIQYTDLSSIFPPSGQPIDSDITTWIERLQPWILSLWVSGIIILLLRWSGTMFYLSMLKKKAVCLDKSHTLFIQWKKLLANRKIQKNIRLALSHHISTPMILGQIKPVVLLPFSLINNLTTEEVECILLHEVAHYIRYDWWVNLMQSWVEILFYYHPAVYYVSSFIRRERENCCDEYAISTLGGENIPYAKTLIKLQEWENSPNPALALAFSNNPKIFIDRIQKILNMNQRKNVKNENILIGMILVASLFFVNRESIAKNFNYEDATSYVSDFFNFTTPSRASMPRDTMPKNEEKITIIKKGEEKEVKIEMKNGEIQHMEINGEEIKPEDYDKHKDLTRDVHVKTIRRQNKPEDSYFFFDMDGDNLHWNGNFEFDMDSLLGDIDWENMKDHQIHMEKLQKKMHKMQEKMKDQKIRIFGLDSMITLEMPERRMEWIFTPDEMEGGRIFEFHGQDKPRIEKRIEIDRRDGTPRIEERIEIHRNDEKPRIEKRFHFDNEDIFRGSRSTSDVLGAQLNKDGLLLPQKENKIELTGKYLKINGEKQPSNIWNKYKRIFEEESGTTLEKNSRITFHFLGKDSKRQFKFY